MDREGFRNRLKQYKKAREENPGLKYWAWKDDVVASFRSALDSTKLDRNKVYNRIPAREWAPGKQSNDPSAIINAGTHESLYHYEFGNDSYAQQLVNAANKVIDNPRSYEYEVDDAIAYLAHEDAKDVYLGLPQRTGLIQLSVYKPTNAKDLNTIYYKFLHQTPEYWDNPNGSVIQDLLWQKFDGTNSKHYIDKTLNEFTGYISTDPNKGEYVSIYDIWDYNTAVTAGGKDNIHKYIPGSKPFEIYDRIYLDDYYGVSSAPEKGDYYGGYLPEIEIKPYAEGGEAIGPPTYEEWYADMNKYNPTIWDGYSMYVSLNAAKQALHQRAMELPGYAPMWNNYVRSLPKDNPDINEFVDDLWLNENPNNVGYKNGRYYPHKSPEGGAATIGPGFKLGSGSHRISTTEAYRGMTKQRLNQEARRIGKQHLDAVNQFINYGQDTNPADTVSPQIKMGLMDLRHQVGPLGEWSNLRNAVLEGDLDKIRKESTVTWNDDGEIKVDKRRKKIRDEKYFHY